MSIVPGNKRPERNYYLISKKPRWGLTFPGFLFIILITFLIILLLFNRLYPILAPVEKVNATILVVEGATNDHVLKEAILEFNSGNYIRLITTGTPLEFGSVLSEYGNTATLAGMSLLKMGLDSTRLVMAGTNSIQNDRTYNSALELKRWLSSYMPEIKDINLISMGVHGGRSRLLFKAALGDSFNVGIISVPSQYYGRSNWWKTSKGFRETINEAIGYFYTRFFFRPY